MISSVMTQESQTEMTTNEILNDLLEGNRRFVKNSLNLRNLPAQVKATTSGQFPKAVILSCIDSRVPVELVFDQGIGDIFVARVAGNVENEDVLGSIEYSVGVAGSKLIMVLGHESCGAVKSAVKKLDVGSENVTFLLNQIEPAILSIAGERDYKDKNYLADVIKSNVKLTIEDIRKRSAIVRNLEAEGKIQIVGAYYNLHDGSVSLLE
ncbi:MAG: carbonic anhydrase [Calditrichaeota bacterium]|nr:MAG: carbonic anhydrase [Calditrichota bacterium]